jgi:hypothetical protein
VTKATPPPQVKNIDSIVTLNEKIYENHIVSTFINSLGFVSVPFNPLILQAGSSPDISPNHNTRRSILLASPYDVCSILL